MTLETISTGLAFAEGLRWHEGALWFSDFYLRTVFRLAPTNDREAVAVIDGDSPSGLGWLPDGTMLIVSMRERALLRLVGSKLQPYADLSAYIGDEANDLYVDSEGRAYVSQSGSKVVSTRQADGRFEIIVPPKPSSVVLVADHLVRAACVAELSYPNGMVERPDGLFVVAETVGRRLSIYERDAEGLLVNRRTLAAVQGRPDGLAADAQSGIWFADPERGACTRIDADGNQTDHIETGRSCFSCALGGPNGDTLFMALGQRLKPDAALRDLPGSIVTAQVAVPAA